MMRFLAIAVGTCGCLALPGCTSNDPLTAGWIAPFQSFLEELARNALAAFLI
ncbi:MAG: hypothetical protein SF069_07215 [Phycisphaerae bacterium]|nr:hypothetical protein [Phycisphaerae bacterium]